MREELEAYLRMLEADLEVEVDLHGGRTRLATDLRSLILYTSEELASLKTDSVTTVTEIEVVYR
jgi:phosphopantetheine adenylyltransferase